MGLFVTVHRVKIIGETSLLVKAILQRNSGVPWTINSSRDSQGWGWGNIPELKLNAHPTPALTWIKLWVKLAKSYRTWYQHLHTRVWRLYYVFDLINSIGMETFDFFSLLYLICLNWKLPPDITFRRHCVYRWRSTNTILITNLINVSKDYLVS